jgi:hypothetical protein
MCGRCGGARGTGGEGRLQRQHLLDGLTCHAEFAGDIRLGPPVFDESPHEVTAFHSKPPSLSRVLDGLCPDLLDALNRVFV